MRFLADIIRRTDKRAKPATVQPLHEPVEPVADLVETPPSAETPVFSKMHRQENLDYTAPDGPVSSLNELLDKWTAEVATKQAPAPIEKRSPAASRRNRVKTRLLGFEHSGDGGFDAIDTLTISEPDTKVASPLYPVGWLVIVEGPGRGNNFTLTAGLSQIGRDSDQAVQLNFGDEAISGSNHTAVVYDPASHTFLLGHGDKTNTVRLNNTPLINTGTLRNGDKITIGETTLQLAVFSTPDQNWDVASVSNESLTEEPQIATA
ncbi:MAG: FHA domain-containing protein [Litoreibacter sp.]